MINNPLTLYGMFIAKQRWRDFSIVYLMLLSAHILIIFTFADYRVRIVFMPLFFIFMSWGILELIKRWKKE